MNFDSGYVNIFKWKNNQKLYRHYTAYSKTHSPTIKPKKGNVHLLSYCEYVLSFEL